MIGYTYRSWPSSAFALPPADLIIIWYSTTLIFDTFIAHGDFVLRLSTWCYSWKTTRQALNPHQAAMLFVPSPWRQPARVLNICQKWLSSAGREEKKTTWLVTQSNLNHKLLNYFQKYWYVLILFYEVEVAKDFYSKTSVIWIQDFLYGSRCADLSAFALLFKEKHCSNNKNKRVFLFHYDQGLYPGFLVKYLCFGSSSQPRCSQVQSRYVPTTFSR